ncbi:hypothetical protein [Treponema vincentii]|uniref:hypothetical protein n=1 Tax=Treponema vincentii TaxID=69710 RepID=UPI001E47F972|nr:hypothetical protein [Treponema vincentii]
MELFGQRFENPLGPAAGPHTQLAQNIVAAYAAGCRFFELKTVQKLDGERPAGCKAVYQCGGRMLQCRMVYRAARTAGF